MTSPGIDSFFAARRPYRRGPWGRGAQTGLLSLLVWACEGEDQQPPPEETASSDDTPTPTLTPAPGTTSSPDVQPSAQPNAQSRDAEPYTGPIFVFFRKSISDQTLMENEAFALSLEPYFVGRGPISYEVRDLPEGLYFSEDTMRLEGVITQDEAIGTHAITVVARAEGGTTTVSQFFDIQVHNINETPFRTSQPAGPLEYAWSVPLSLELSGTPASLFSDADLGDTLAYQVEGLPDSFQVVTNADATVLSGMVDNEDALGVHSFTIRVQDSAGEFVTDTFTLTLTPNHGPRVGQTLTQLEIYEDRPVSEDLRPYFEDDDVGDILTFKLGHFPPGLTVEDGVLTGVVEQAAEVHSVVVTAFDGAGEFVRLQFDLKVHETNRAPLRREDFTGTLTLTEDVLFQMDLASLYRDEDRLDRLVYSLEGEMPEFRLLEHESLHPVSSRPVTVTLLEGRFTDEERLRSLQTLTLTVRDQAGETLSDTLMVTIQNVNDAPSRVLETPHVFTVDEGESFTLDLAELYEDDDPDDVLSFRLGGQLDRLEEARILEGVLTGVFESELASTRPQRVEIEITDGQARLVDEIVFVVNEVNEAPLVTTPLPLQVFEEFETIRLDLSDLFSDPDEENGRFLTLSVEGLPTGLAWNAERKHITGAVTDPLLVGLEHLITVTAVDPYEAQGTGYVTVSITGVDDPLRLVEALPDQQGFSTAFDLQAYYVDPDGDPIAFTFSLEGPYTPDVTYDAPRLSLSWTEAPGTFGSVTIHVEASSTSFTLTDSFVYRHVGIRLEEHRSTVDSVTWWNLRDVQENIWATDNFIPTGVPNGLGDIDGDGVPDIALAAEYLSPPGRSTEDRAFVLYGRRDFASIQGPTYRGSLTPDAGFELVGAANQHVVALGAGDVNGDGLADILVNYLDPAYQTESYVVFGVEERTRSSVDLSSLAPSEGFVIQKKARESTTAAADTADEDGFWVSPAGDLNRDGFSDLLLEDGRGRFEMIFGQDTPIGQLVAVDPYAAASDVVFRQVFTTGAPEGRDLQLGWTVLGPGVLSPLAVWPYGDGFLGKQYLGNNIVRAHGGVAGDVDRKRNTDLAFFVQETLQEDNPTSDTPLVRLYVLTSLGSSAEALAVALPWLVYTSDTLSPVFGPVGDFDGDSYNEFAVASPDELHDDTDDTAGDPSDTTRPKGVVRLFYGRQEDHFSLPPITGLSAGTGIPARSVAFLNDRPEAELGRALASTDLNGDGLAELIIGAPHPDAPGRVYILFGKSDRPKIHVETGEYLGTTEYRFDLATLAPEDGFYLEGSGNGDMFGRSLSQVGDVNGDGFYDLLIGASGTHRGFLFYGSAAWGMVSTVGMSLDATEEDSPRWHNWRGRAGDDVFTSHEGTSYFHGGSGDDRLVFNSDVYRFRLFDGGLGDDSVVVTSTTLLLDDINVALRFRSVESFTLSDATLYLEPRSLFHLTEQRHEGEAQLHLYGTGTVHLTGGSDWHFDAASESWFFENSRLVLHGAAPGDLQVHAWRDGPSLTINLDGPSSSPEVSQRFFNNSHLGDGQVYTQGGDINGDGGVDLLAHVGRTTAPRTDVLPVFFIGSDVQDRTQVYTITEGRVTLQDGSVRYKGDSIRGDALLSDGELIETSETDIVAPRFTQVGTLETVYQLLDGALINSEASIWLRPTAHFVGVGPRPPSATEAWVSNTLVDTDDGDRLAERAPLFQLTSGMIAAGPLRLASYNDVLPDNFLTHDGESEVPSWVTVRQRGRILEGTITLTMNDGAEIPYRPGSALRFDLLALFYPDFELVPAASGEPGELWVIEPGTDDNGGIDLLHAKLRTETVVDSGEFAYYRVDDTQLGPGDYIKQGQPTFDGSFLTITDDGRVLNDAGVLLGEAAPVRHLEADFFTLPDGTYYTGPDSLEEAGFDLSGRLLEEREDGGLFVYESSSAKLQPLERGNLQGLAETFSIDAESRSIASRDSLDLGGDINGDGLPDLLLGLHPRLDGTSFYAAGRIGLLYGDPDFENGRTDDSGTADYQQIVYNNAVRPLDYFGVYTRHLGDLDGDLLDDFVAWGRDRLGPEDTWVGVVLSGHESQYDGAQTNIATLSESEALHIITPWRMSSGVKAVPAGDVNGDGRADLIVNAKFEYSGTSQGAKSWLIYGSSEGLGTLYHEIQTRTATSEIRVNGSGQAVGDRYEAGSALTDGEGRAIRTVGTNLVDADDEILGTIVVRRLLDLSRLSPEEGVVFKTTPWTEETLWAGNSPVNADGSVTQYFEDVSSAGDINGDGYDDLMFSYEKSDATNVGTGTYTRHVAVLFGSADGVPAQEETQILSGFPQVLATPGWGLDEARTLTLKPGKGLPSDTVLLGEGAMRSTDGSTITFDEEADVQLVQQNVLYLDRLSSEQGFYLEHATPAAWFGDDIGSIGDINGDGFDDIAVGARGDPLYYQPSNVPASSNALRGRGRAYVVYGMEDSFGTEVTASIPGPGALRATPEPWAVHNGGVLDQRTLDAVHLNADQGFVVQISSQENVGGSLAGLGDVDGDGFDDFSVASKFAERAYIVYGSPAYRPGGQKIAFEEPGPITQTGGLILRGDLKDDRLTGGLETETLLGGAGDDRLAVADNSFVRVDGGTGLDTLALLNDVTLDLEANVGKIRSIEALSLTDSSHAQLTARVFYRLTEARHNSDELTAHFDIRLTPPAEPAADTAAEAAGSMPGELWFYVQGEGTLELREGYNTATESHDSRWTPLENLAENDGTPLVAYRLDNVVLLLDPDIDLV